MVAADGADGLMADVTGVGHLFGGEGEIGSNALEVHIHHLRRKLGQSYIRTVRGVGYLVPKAAA